MKATLILEDGTVYVGESFGAEGEAVGEVCFDTGMTGYQEVLTDPSFFGQLVCMTYPIQGNYGVNSEDNESDRPWPKGFIVRECCSFPSNFRCEGTLADYLKKNGIIGIERVDTRALTRKLRESGVMNGVITTAENPDVEACVRRAKEFAIRDAVRNVTCAERREYPAEGEAKFKVALYDFGNKRNITRCLNALGCDVSVLPAATPAQEVLDGGFDGVMLSNGPGNPAENTEIIEELKILLDSGLPVFGICLGHQLMALAAGARSEKLKYGHRGGNHPVKDLALGKTYITSQNHGYAIVGESLPPQVGEVSHINMNDGTVEGVRYKNRPVFTVQFHPEASPGPRDTRYLFDEFLDLMKGGAR
ncbi:carbamoyl phosphate synthase small subunit [Feifania hominis]|uniref:Carbamoyl phosphate synthase small chain n=1 Tax=Feifania hominis TaxID=2763660 RepID=A0A926HTA5_9FIRM|nr:carbamoyl phosphate synthase small subunit [Feifania hominis]MBC8535113.1 glutamine-hydrolyzing carbamoyl-phosphate synthase small subunit [Feifania hominis]